MARRVCPGLTGSWFSAGLFCCEGGRVQAGFLPGRGRSSAWSNWDKHLGTDVASPFWVPSQRPPRWESKHHSQERDTVGTLVGPLQDGYGERGRKEWG